MSEGVANFAGTKHLKFRGFARVDLTTLSFDHSRALSIRNVKRLQKIFELEGCQRQDDRNFVDALISEEQLQCVLVKQPLALQKEPIQKWEGQPILIASQLSCLTGQHRIKAAQQHLDTNDCWWIARMFTDNLPNQPRLRLAEEFLNERPPTDGEIFYNIRRYHADGDKGNELKWWARLSDTKRKDLRQLLSNQRYVKAFDDMLPWPGLWTPVKLGCLHRLLSMKCDEELLSYLMHITTIWAAITKDITSNDVVDTNTVTQLQTLAPGHSSVDLDTVSSLFDTSSIFTKMSNMDSREQLRRNISFIETPIPSLYTFFEDIKYLEPCAKVLKTLLPFKTRQSIYKSLMGSFFEQQEPLVEHAYDDLRVHNSSRQTRIIAYQQLWLFALRNFPLMTNFTTRKTQDREKPLAIEPSPSTWQEFGKLAITLGFKTPSAEELQSQDPSQLIVTQLLERYAEGSSTNLTAVRKIAGILRSVKRQQEAPEAAEFFSDKPLLAIERCGRPFEGDHYMDKSNLYLPQMYHIPSSGENLTTFYRKWNMFRVFLGIKDLENFDNDRELGSCFDAQDCANIDDDPLTEILGVEMSEGGSLHQQLVHRIRNSDSTISRLNKRLEDLQHEVANSDTIQRQGSSRVRELEARLSSCNSEHYVSKQQYARENTSLQQQIQRGEQTIADRDQQVAFLITAKSTEAKKLQDITECLGELDMLSRQKDEENKQLKIQIQQLQSNASLALQEQLSSISIRAEQAEALVCQLKSEGKALQQAYENRKVQCDSLEVELTEKVEAAENLAYEYKLEGETIQEQLSEASDRADQADTLVCQLTSEGVALQQEYENRKVRCDSLEVELTGKLEAAENLAYEYKLEGETVLDQLSVASDRAEQGESAVDRLESEKSELIRRQTAEKTRFDEIELDLRTKLASSSNRAEEAERLVDRYKAEGSSFMQKYATEKAQIEETESELRDLLVDSSTRADQAENDLRKLKSEEAELQLRKQLSPSTDTSVTARAERAENAVRRLKVETLSLRAKLQAAVESLEQSRKEKLTIREEISELQSKNEKDQERLASLNSNANATQDRCADILYETLSSNSTVTTRYPQEDDLVIYTYVWKNNLLLSCREYFSRNEVEDTVEGIELCSQADRWDYAFGPEYKRAVISLCRDKGSLVQAWLQGTRLARWPNKDRGPISKALNMEYKYRPKASLKRDQPMTSGQNMVWESFKLQKSARIGQDDQHETDQAEASQVEA